MICETAINKDFERGFDDSYIKQLHNAEREVLQSFFPDPNVNVSRHYVQDALPVIRGMARMEEHRKASGLGYSKKRHSRSKFLHYFEYRLTFPVSVISLQCQLNFDMLALANF